MELKELPGIGAAKVDKLAKIGVTDLKSMAEIDLRSPPDVGISSDVLRRAKAQARRILDKQGVSYRRATYGAAKGNKPAAKNGAAKPAAKKGAAKPAAKAASTKAAAKPKAKSVPAQPKATPKKSFWARLLRR